MEPLLKVVRLSKSFGALPIIKQLSFEVYPGEVVGLAGWGDAGKSVIAKLLTGLYTPDEGDVYFSGRCLKYPFRAQPLGIELISQQPELVELLDITNNIFLGRELYYWPSLGKWVNLLNHRRMDKEAADILANLGLSVDSLREKVSRLSGEQRQLLTIAKVMLRPAKLIIVDEPTDWLSYSYQQKLMSLIRSWRRQSVAVIFCSKDLEHMFSVTDRIIVLRQGECVATHSTDDTSREELVVDLIGATPSPQITPAIWALDNYYRARQQAEILRHQQLLLEQNLATQGTLNQQLVDQLAQQVKALDQVNLALQDAQRRLLSKREEERKRLARELHDEIIQDLVSINLELENIEASKDVTTVLRADLIDIRESIRILIADVRRICGDLRPPTIDSLGLGSALLSYTRTWSERTRISVYLDLAPDFGRLPESIELSLFRIVQEGLNNVRKHSQATSVRVQLQHTSPRTLVISIADNGKGIVGKVNLSSLSADGHFGLLGLSERVALLGGHLKIRSQDEGGLLLQAEIPHPRVEDATLGTNINWLQ